METLYTNTQNRVVSKTNTHTPVSSNFELGGFTAEAVANIRLSNPNTSKFKVVDIDIFTERYFEKLAESSFEELWDNDDDSIYDTL
ncbi:hypothetical protein N8083_00355 [Candidatus Pacebacteria bacterium]|nr:hypothetical protein [Candidatus Paceibacterota bacterium]